MESYCCCNPFDPHPTRWVYSPFQWSPVDLIFPVTSELPNLSTKNVNAIFQVTLSSFLIMRNDSRMYIGKVFDMYKTGSSGRYGSVTSSTNLAELQAVSILAYLPLLTVWFPSLFAPCLHWPGWLGYTFRRLRVRWRRHFKYRCSTLFLQARLDTGKSTHLCTNQGRAVSSRINRPHSSLHAIWTEIGDHYVIVIWCRTTLDNAESKGGS